MHAKAMLVRVRVEAIEPFTHQAHKASMDL
jgi:hypothetical protein